MKNIRHDSPGLRYGTSQRKGQLSGVGEAVTQGWKGVNPAAAWQAGGGGGARAWGEQGPVLQPRWNLWSISGAWRPGSSLYPLIVRFNQGWVSLGFR